MARNQKQWSQPHKYSISTDEYICTTVFELGCYQGAKSKKKGRRLLFFLAAILSCSHCCCCKDVEVCWPSSHHCARYWSPFISQSIIYASVAVMVRAGNADMVVAMDTDAEQSQKLSDELMKVLEVKGQRSGWLVSIECDISVTSWVVEVLVG